MDYTRRLRISWTDTPSILCGSLMERHPPPKKRRDNPAIFFRGLVDGTPPATKGARLAADLRVAYAEPNYIGQTPESRQQSSWTVGGDSGVYRAQWASDKMRLPEAHTVTQGASVIVAVLDTGADLSHP